MAMEYTSQVRKYISERNIERDIRRMHRGMVITKDTNVSVVPGLVKDIEWNAMDLWHRIWVHHTYLEHMQVFSGRDFAVNVTRLGKLPFFSQVANAKIAPGLLHQTMTMWGIFFVHQVVKLEQLDGQVRIEVDWYIASHRLFRLLHRPFNWRLRKLQTIQDAEDLEIRDRRHTLRNSGFGFEPDDFDFLNSNDLGDQLAPPALGEPVRFRLGELPYGEVRRFKSEGVELLAERTPDGVQVWPAICPHAGAELREEHLCEGVVECPWHGRKFPAVSLSASRTQWRFLNQVVELQGEELVVTTISNAVGSTR